MVSTSKTRKDFFQQADVRRKNLPKREIKREGCYLLIAKIYIYVCVLM